MPSDVAVNNAFSLSLSSPAGEKMAGKPTAAFALVLIGGILVLIGGLVTLALGAVTSVVSSIGGLGVATDGALGLIFGVIMIVSALMLNNTDKKKVTMWSVIALIFSLLSLANGGGFVIGFILGLIGSILGLTYKG